MPKFLVFRYNIQLEQKDLNNLHPLNWINDLNINFFVGFLNEI